MIDNATLTGVERLLGRIKVKNEYNIEGDILCLENLLEAILFYDEWVFIDDYKDEFKQSRSEFFQFLQPVEIESDFYLVCEMKARQIVEDLSPVIKNGIVKSSLLDELLKLISLNLIFTWDLQSSEYYLTLKLLSEASNVELDKYGSLAAMITSAVAEKNRVDHSFKAEKLKILDPSGKELIDGKGAIVKLR